MEQLLCKACGGQLTREDNGYFCRYCGTHWMVDAADDIRAVDRANAWSALRDGDFEKATELFEHILLAQPKNHEAYWGRALARNGIMYVVDLNEAKKVPTCNNITEEPFLQSADVKKAIDLAPAGVANSYREQAERIEAIRVEWLEKARKEPPYDVFICFKDSDREHGIERTTDSVDAQDLYNALTAEGYKVFFSRISLRNKVAEHYEPYIYNALKTAKVMIVFGEHAEYFNAVWLRNEWGRFKNYIEKGEKHKNSLVVVYKDMHPGDLPAALRARQCLNAADMTFLSDLNKHIARVIAEVEKTVRLDRITIKGGQIAKKATTLNTNQIKVRELGDGAVAKTDINDKQMMDLAKAYFESGEWGDADKLLDDVLFNTPNLAEALYLKLLCKHKVSRFLNALPGFDRADFGALEKILGCADKDFAEEILRIMYASYANVSNVMYQKILEFVLPYNCSGRALKIHEAFEFSIREHRYDIFCYLLTTLASDDVDRYIQYNWDYAKAAESDEERQKCMQAILDVDAGNMGVLEMRFSMLWKTASTEELLQRFEELLKYSKDTHTQMVSVLRRILNGIDRAQISAFAKEFFKYYDGDEKDTLDALRKVADKMIEGGYFEDAQYLLSLAIPNASQSPEIYWALCLVKLKARNENEIVRSKIMLKSLPEYTKYLTMVSGERRSACFELVKKQEQQKKAAKLLKLSAVAAVFCAAIICAFAVYANVIRPPIYYEQGNQLLLEGKIEEAYEKLSKIEDYKDTAAIIESIQAPARERAVALVAEKKYQEAYDVLASVGWAKKTTLTSDAIAALEVGDYKTAIDEHGVRDIIIQPGTTIITKYAFWGCVKLRSVIIPDGVTSIESCAFTSCCKLKSITIPDSVTSIGEAAFSGCDKLKSITVPNGVTSIGSCAFDYCDNLKSVTIPDSVTSIGQGAFRGCNNLESVTLPYVNSNYGLAYFFGYNTSFRAQLVPNSLKSVIITSATSIDGFSGCNKIESITLPANLETIRASAFEGCKNLKSITIPDSVTSIGDCAFSGCSSLTSVTIPDSVTSIGEDAFYRCSKLIQKENGVHYVDKWVIDCGTNVTNVTLRANTVAIGEDAFKGRSSLTSVTIPDSVTSIGDRAFFQCHGLKSVTIGSGVTSIGDEAFQYCNSLRSVTFENPNGWWCASSTATSGTSISASDLADTSIAATYLTSTYDNYYWKRG